MSVYLSFDGDEPTMLASNTGWADVSRWIDDLNAQQFGEVVHLAEHGWSQQLDKLESQLQSAVKASKPESTVSSTLADLLSLLAHRETAEVATINDGMAP